MKKILKSKWFWIPTSILIFFILFINYKLAYKGTVKYVTFTSNDITIEGVLVTPKSKGSFPAIILLQGSGGSHQEYNKMYNKLHTNALLEKGFAVLSYTKRGSGDNDVDYNYVSFKHLVDDAISAINFVKKQERIDPNNIGLLAVSESGWFSPEIAYISKDIKFIINRVSSPFTWRETVIHEVRMDAKESGFTDKEIEDVIVPTTLERWQFYINAHKTNNTNLEERKSLNDKLKTLSSDEKYNDWFSSKLPEYDSLFYAARAQKYGYDPQPFLKNIEIPMLYIMAGQDVNIPTEQSIKALETLKDKNHKDITVKLFPNTNHYLYKSKFLPIEGLYVNGYLDLIGTWAKDQTTNN